MGIFKTLVSLCISRELDYIDTIVQYMQYRQRTFQKVEDLPFNPCHVQDNTIIILPICSKKMQFRKTNAGWTKADNKVPYSLTLFLYDDDGLDCVRRGKISSFEEEERIAYMIMGAGYREKT